LQTDADSSERGAFKIAPACPNPYYIKQSQKSVIPIIKTVPVKIQATRFITMKFKDAEKQWGTVIDHYLPRAIYNYC
jgi:hypothetical protein